MKRKKKISLSLANLYNQYQLHILIIAVLLTAFEIFYKPPEKPPAKVETYEECEKQPGSTSRGVDPKNHKYVCSLKDGRRYYKTTPPTLPDFDKWHNVSSIQKAYSLTPNNIETKTYYDFKAPYEDYYPMQITSSRITIHESGLDQLSFSIYLNESYLDLVNFISRFKIPPDNKVVLKPKSNNLEKIFINKIPGYKLSFDDLTYVFLKHPNTSQVIVFYYKTDPNWYSHHEIVSIFEKIISTTIFEPEGHW